MVVDALSGKAEQSLNTIIITQPCMLEDSECLGVGLISHEKANALLSALKVKSSLIEEMKFHQKEDTKLQRIRQNLEKDKSPGFLIDEDGTLRFQNHLCVSDRAELREKILTEAHNTRYSLHALGTKMY